MYITCLKLDCQIPRIRIFILPLNIRPLIVLVIILILLFFHTFSITVKPRFTVPRFTANPDFPFPFPQIELILKLHNVNKPRFTRGCFLSPNTAVNWGFTMMYQVLVLGKE